MRLNKYINVMLFISLASCHNEEEQAIPPTPTMSSFVPGSRLEWRKLMASDGSKIDALIPPRFWDKERKEPCDLAYASEIEKKQNIYRCLPVFELDKNEKYTRRDTTVFADSSCSQPVVFFNDADYAKKYPGKYVREAGFFFYDRESRVYFYVIDTTNTVTNFYEADFNAQTCKTIQKPDKGLFNIAYRAIQMNPNDFVMVSF